MISISGATTATNGDAYTAIVSATTYPIGVIATFNGKALAVKIETIDGRRRVTIKLPKNKRGFLSLYVTDGNPNGGVQTKNVGVR